MCEEHCLSEDWSVLPGFYVQIRHGFQDFRKGWVEDAMPDGSALWLAQDGPLERKLIAKVEGFTARVAGCTCP